MSKVLAASCQAGVVTIGQTTVAADILSEGNGASSGVAILDEGAVYYLTSSAEDLKNTISSIVDILNDLTTTLTAIDGATNSPGANAASISAIAASVTALELTKDLLK